MHKVCCFQFNPWKPFSDLLLHEAKTSKRWDPHSDTYLACFAKIKSEYTRPATLGKRNSWQNLAIYMYVHSKNRWKIFSFLLLNKSRSDWLFITLQKSTTWLFSKWILFLTRKSFYQEVLVSVIRAIFLQILAGLAHGDSVDGRLPPELLNKLPLLLELLHFSFVRKHWDLRQSLCGAVKNLKSCCRESGWFLTESRERWETGGWSEEQRASAETRLRDEGDERWCDGGVRGVIISAHDQRMPTWEKKYSWIYPY